MCQKIILILILLGSFSSFVKGDESLYQKKHVVRGDTDHDDVKELNELFQDVDDVQSYWHSFLDIDVQSLFELKKMPILFSDANSVNELKIKGTEVYRKEVNKENRVEILFNEKNLYFNYEFNAFSLDLNFELLRDNEGNILEVILKNELNGYEEQRMKCYSELLSLECKNSNLNLSLRRTSNSFTIEFYYQISSLRYDYFKAYLTTQVL